jgi:multidrug efflux system membrane fusion protein
MRNATLLLFLVLACGPKSEEAPAAAARTISDESSVTMPRETAQQNGITVVALQPASQQTTVVIGNATVVDVTELVNAASQYAAALAQRDQAAAHLQASRATLERLRALNADDHNVSDRAVQEAAAAASSDEAGVRSAEVSALAAEAAARQRWGTVLARGVIGGAPWARQLASREAVLIEAAFTGEGAPPPQIEITGAMGRPVVARHLAVSPRVDARLQRPVHDYLAPASELPVGLITSIHAPLAAQGGVLVPKDAVVWHGSQALVFVEDRPGHYVQHPIGAQLPLDGGYVEALPPGTRVVIAGAQQLLSEQNKPEVE